MNLQSQLIIGGLIFLLGLAAGLLVFWLTKDDDKKPEQPAEHAAAATAHPPVGGAVKVGTIWREESGQMLIQAPDGSLLENEAAQKLLQKAWMPPGQVNQATLAGLPPTPEMAPPRQVQPDLANGAPLENIAPPRPVEYPARPLYTSVEPVRANALNNIGRAFQRPRPPAPRSLAMQINDILQENIAGSELARRGLCLVDLPDHELGVELDLHIYHDIDQVPDPAATQAIRDAAKEWQAKNR